MPNRRIFFLLFFMICCALSVFSKPRKSDLNSLDKLLDNRREYIDIKKSKINYLKQIQDEESNIDRKYNVTFQIIEEYSNFQADSAFANIELNRNLASNLDQILQNQFQYVFVLAQSGLLNEAEVILKSLQKHIKPRSRSEIEYYQLNQRLYMNLKEFSQNTHLEKMYDELQYSYCDSILELVPADSKEFQLYQFRKDFQNGSYELAKSHLEQYIQVIDTLSNDGARAYYYMSEIYRMKQDNVNQEFYLIKSVEADVISAVMQNRSLRVLAHLLYIKGDIERAYRYLQISLDDANFYNTRLRNMQVAEILPIIKKDYELQKAQKDFKLKIGIFIITLLFIVVLLISLYLRKKRHELIHARKELIASNNRLKQMNNEMMETNEKLNLLSSKLKDSDRTKEKYIGHILKLCASYIQNIGDFKKLINRKIKAGQIEDAYNLTLSSQQSNEFKEFYNEFDNAFLNIYPQFVNQFNTLLREDQQFNLKKPNTLNTELRIFALIRLGIKDSSQIADFMNYTPVTIYSYRTKVKSRAINKEKFDEDILKIGD